MLIRMAEHSDIEALIKMRLDFTLEYNADLIITESIFEEYYQETKKFLESAIESKQWYIWVAEINGIIVSHIFLELIAKVPRPGRRTNPFVYMTNVYTLPYYRGKGIGSELLCKIKDWSKANHFEFIIVWPSDEGIEFYRKNEYVHCKEPMELMLE
ncbi:MAG: N-acetyltransferase family protein [Bacillota bacterium]